MQTDPFSDGTIALDKQRGFFTIDDDIAALREASKNPIQRIPTGLWELDRAVVGVGVGEMLLFAARAGNGKSAFATQVMVNNPKVPMIFFSLEMPRTRVIQRLYAQVTGQHADEVEEEIMRQNVPHNLDTVATHFQSAIVVDRPGLRFSDMEAYIQNFHDHFLERPKLVIIDYLELIGGLKSKGEVSTETVAAAANQAKEFAVEQGLAIILLHQLNQSVQEWEPPNKNSLRYGGLAEADFVVGLWRPGMDPKATANQERWVGINVIKNRIFGREPRNLHFVLNMAMQFTERNRNERR